MTVKVKPRVKDAAPSGFYLSEVSHPYDVLTKEGYEIDFVSPKEARHVDGLDLSDPVNASFGIMIPYARQLKPH